MTTNGIHFNLPLELSNPPGPPQSLLSNRYIAVTLFDRMLRRESMRAETGFRTPPFQTAVRCR